MSLKFNVLVNDEKKVAFILDEIDPANKQQHLISISLAKHLSLPLLSISQATAYDFGLFFEDGILKLQQYKADPTGAVWVEFSTGKSAYRHKHQAKGKLPISRACGIKQNQRPTIIDATAGLGEDAFVLAGLGCQVLCIEQQPVLAALLLDGLSRAQQDASWLKDIVSRMQLKQGLAESILGTETAEVVYLDPMYPHQQSRKQAKVKKAMQLLRSLPGTVSDEEKLLNAARLAASQRVVVKRPNWAPHMADAQPSLQIKSKSHRFDIYLTDHL